MVVLVVARALEPAHAVQSAGVVEAGIQVAALIRATARARKAWRWTYSPSRTLSNASLAAFWNPPVSAGTSPQCSLPPSGWLIDSVPSPADTRAVWLDRGVKAT